MASLTAIVAMTLVEPPSKGPELTIYRQYSILFWALVLSAMALPLWSIALSAFRGQRPSGIDFSIFLVAQGLVLLLPYIRGYAFYPAGDAETHVGLMRDILANGHAGESNFYPALHYLGVTLWQVLGLEATSLIQLLVLVYLLFFWAGIVLCAYAVANKWSERSYAIVLAAPFLYSARHIFIHPSMLSIYAVPIAIYAFHKSAGRNPVRSYLVLLVTVLFITITHPLTTFLIVVMFAAAAAALAKAGVDDRGLHHRGYRLSIFAGVILLTWITSYSIFARSFQRVYRSLIGLDATSTFERTTNALALAKPTFAHLLEIATFRFGSTLLLLLVGMISSLGIIRWCRGADSRADRTALMYLAFFAGGGALAGASFFTYTGEGDIVRIARFFLVSVPFVTAAFIVRLRRGVPDRQNTQNRILVGAFICVVTVLIVVNVLALHGTTRTVVPNWQVTETEQEVTKWHYGHRNHELIVLSAGFAVDRTEQSLFGFESNPTPVRWNRTYLPSHFGYPEAPRLSEYHTGSDAYLIATEAGRDYFNIYPVEVRTVARQYAPEDFARLTSDSRAEQIYSNGAAELWFLDDSE